MLKKIVSKWTLVFASILLLCGGCDRDKKPVLRMVTEATFPPYEYFSGSEIIGIDADIVRHVATQLGYDLEIQDMSFDSVITAVQSGKADIAASGITVTEDRKKSIDFTVPYVTSSLLIIAKDGSPITKPGDLKGKRIGVQHGTTSDLYVSEHFGDPERFQNGGLAVEALMVGKIDVAVMDQDPARVHVSKQPGIHLLDSPLTSEYYAFAFQKGSPLVKKFDEILNEMKANGDLNKYIEKYRSNLTKGVPSEKEKKGFWNKMKSSFHLNFIKESRYMYLVRGLGVTLSVSVVAILIGVALGFLIAIIRTTADQTGKLKVGNAICKLYLTVVRGTPVVVQLMIIYFVIFASLDISKVFVAMVAFGLNSGAYVAEIVRGGIQSIDIGQMEAGRSLGLSYTQTMTHIIIPQAFKNVLPALGNEFIALLKETSVAGYIALQDLTKGADIIRSQTYDAFLPLIVVAMIYLGLVILFSRLLARLEKRLKVNE